MGLNTGTAETSLHVVAIPPSSVTDDFAIQCLLLASGFQHHEDAFGEGYSLAPDQPLKK